MTEPLLKVTGLTVEFLGRHGTVRAVDDVSFTIGRGEIIGLVGESASGKSTLGLALMRMVPSPGRISSGSISLEGQDLAALSEAEMRTVRGSRISLIVQDALATMNPVTTIGEQIEEVIRDHGDRSSRAERMTRAATMLREVRLPNVDQNLRRFPHELSGGMQQRVAIAEGLVLGPQVIIADEPTTALDVTVQAQILSLLREICDTRGTSIVFVTHDLATVAEICDRVMVMYAGRIVESGTVREVFRQPAHPYTKALLSGLLPLAGEPLAELDTLSGQPPRPEDWPTGCRFHPRCPLGEALDHPEICMTDDPHVDESQPHWAACHFAELQQPALTEEVAG
ncbi:ABC transporter ATP-binding protein [Cryobacterium tagatosivorans]|uniref:ABC transporter ATP-binding protein n=1 Tax=Cryobacterium tagatosivorans TaxID=1259199 RepID=A0A4R8UJ62_9MICO|nr:ABC transporter ATP-binding protein [Cryobacterium tagatosivorans]TFB56735.1 ABC transporter ATP-binding protein [Cryobacterium tagatosivorans]